MPNQCLWLSSDLGVFIGAMDESGFAYKSGKLHYNDRMLACNGVDFTKEHTTQQVKDIFYQMAQEPLLRMAISRGVSLPEVDDRQAGDGGHVTSESGEGAEGTQEVADQRDKRVVGQSMSSPMATSASASVGGASVEGGAGGGTSTRGESAPEPPKSPRIRKRYTCTCSTAYHMYNTNRMSCIYMYIYSYCKIAEYFSLFLSLFHTVSSSNQATPITLANTRQIGVKRTIEINKGSGKLGIGLTSRDVSTDNKSQPIYIKSIHSGSAAFKDGRLKIGDRLLSVNGIDVQGMRRPEVVSLLRDTEGKVTLVVSRQEAVEEQEQDPAHVSELTRCTLIAFKYYIQYVYTYIHSM